MSFSSPAVYLLTILLDRIATFFASSSLSGAFSGLLAAAIDEINGKGGRPGWAWIFILVGRHTLLLEFCLPSWQEGIFTFLFGVISFFLLPRSPQIAHFLSEEERTYVLSRLREDGAVSQDDKKDRFSWKEVIESAKSPHVLLVAIVFFFNGKSEYSRGTHAHRVYQARPCTAWLSELRSYMHLVLIGFTNLDVASNQRS